MWTLISLALMSFVAAFTVHFVLKSRNMDIWIGSYLKQLVSNFFRRKPSHTHVYFCFADHYEPFWRNDSEKVADDRVKRWVDTYPNLAKSHTDSDGKHPVHTFFYPEEEYRERYLDALKQFQLKGVGDVEIHLHHDKDTAENLTNILNRFKKLLFDKHNLLRKDPITNEIIYSFIHGNWCLDNSRSDGLHCGVDNELSVLVETGCYADLTMPSAPSETQTKKINSIYCAEGKPDQRKSHNTGRDIKKGEWVKENELLLIQGPLALNWKNRKFGIIPKIESSEISHDAPPSAHRVKLWGRCGIKVQGCNDHIFIKAHTHGTVEPTMDMLFSKTGFSSLWSELEKQYRDKKGYSLHYVSAWDMYQKIRELSNQN